MTLVPNDTRPTSAVSGSSDSTCCNAVAGGVSMRWRGGVRRGEGSASSGAAHLTKAVFEALELVVFQAHVHYE